MKIFSKDDVILGNQKIGTLSDLATLQYGFYESHLHKLSLYCSK
jgi:hypothetical protein